MATHDEMADVDGRPLCSTCRAGGAKPRYGNSSSAPLAGMKSDAAVWAQWIEQHYDGRWALGAIAVAAALMFVSWIEGWNQYIVVCRLVVASGLVIVALANGATHSRYGRVMLAGLAIYWFAEVFLGSVGLGWVELGVILYAAAYACLGVAIWLKRTPARPVKIGASAFTGLAILVTIWVQFRVVEDLQGWVMALGVGLAVLAGATISVWERRKSQQRIFEGALALFLGGLLLAFVRFGKPLWLAGILGVPLQFGGLFLLAQSAFYEEAESADKAPR